MPTLTKRKVGNKTYYYAVECQRVEGQPRIVTQKYLGSLDKIIARMTSPVPEPCEAEILEYGAWIRSPKRVPKWYRALSLTGASRRLFFFLRSVNGYHWAVSRTRVQRWCPELWQ